MTRKPVVGVSVAYHDFGDYLSVGFQKPLVMAGGIPLMLSRVEGALDDQLSVVDAVVLSGGRDIEPHRYGQEPSERIGLVDPHRDAFELELVQRAVDRRFDRAGFDRDRTAAAYAARIREVVAIEALASDLAQTVRGSLRPDRLTLWLRESQR